MITVPAFLLALLVLILVHEYGHYRVAVACGVKVLRFSMGFGRVLWRYQKSPEHTEFVLSALPLGGYVRMLDEREGPVPPSQQHLAFNRQPLRARAAIVLAGPLLNLVLAVVLFAASGLVGVMEPKALLGRPIDGSLAERAGMRSGDWVQAWRTGDGDWTPLLSLSDLRWRVTQQALSGQSLSLQVTDSEGRGRREVHLRLDELGATDIDAALMRRIGLGSGYSEPVMGEVKSGGAAAQAGLKAGDRVLLVDGQPVVDAQALRERIRASAQSTQSSDAPPVQRWVVLRGGQRLELEVRPRVVADGAQRVGRIEAYVGQPPAMVKVRRGLVDGVAHGLRMSWEVSVTTLRVLGRMLVGEASLRNLSGPLTMADVAGRAAEKGLGEYLGVLALLSVSLGILNLLPLPILDGGHLMYYLFEGLTGRPVSDLWLERLQRGGIAVLLLMMSVALFNDVAHLFGPTLSAP